MSRDYEDYEQNARRLMAYATEPALLDRVAQLEVLLGDVVRAAVSLLTATATCHGLGTPKADCAVCGAPADDPCMVCGQPVCWLCNGSAEPQAGRCHSCGAVTT